MEQTQSEPSPPDRRRREEEAAKQLAEADDATEIVAAAPEPYARLELGVRSGYAFPAGKATATAAENLDTLVSAQVPIWLDAGARFRGNLFFGVHASYGFGLLSDSLNRLCDQTSAGTTVECRASDVRIGIEVIYHGLREKGIDGWFGGGLGWEWLSFDASETVEGQTQSLSLSANGLQVFMAQAGIDFEPAPGLGLGPFVALSSDIYFSLRTQCQGECGPLGSGTMTIQEKSLHYWIFGGARVSWRP